MALIVGPDKVEVGAHSQVLALPSDYFRSMFGGKCQWVESSTMRVELPDIHPAELELMLQFVQPVTSVTLDEKNLPRCSRSSSASPCGRASPAPTRSSRR